ncbi:MAG: class I SAM-dependent methyltransferase [Pseudomonadota bacterium]|nr:class I SAM-dependent methyltransferase [Pseudomonadota bacterium]
MLKKDQFYKDILDGLSLFYDSRFITDIRNSALRFPVSQLGNALNRRQTASKLWLLDRLFENHGGELGEVHVLGGWYGVLGALILHDPRFAQARITNFDRVPSCAPIAESLNAVHVERDLFCAATADILDIRYTRSGSVVGDTTLSAPDILINTSCEHLNDFTAWFDGLPSGVLLVLQSNDYVSEPEHVNCVEDLKAFKAQAPLAHFVYAGGLELDKYTRFMLIGRK